MTTTKSTNADECSDPGDGLLEDIEKRADQSSFVDTLLTTSFDDQLRLVGDSIHRKNSDDLEADKQKPVKRNRKKKKPVTEQTEPTKSAERPEKPTVYHKSKLYHFENATSKKNPSVEDSNCDEPSNVSTNKRNEIFIEGASHVDCPLIPPPPLSLSSLPEESSQAHASMMMSWYMAGYHTGYYAAIKKFKLCD